MKKILLTIIIAFTLSLSVQAGIAELSTQGIGGMKYGRLVEAKIQKYPVSGGGNLWLLVFDSETHITFAKIKLSDLNSVNKYNVRIIIYDVIRVKK